MRVGLAFWRTLAESPDEWRALLMQELEREHHRLNEFFVSPEAQDTLEWVLAYLRSFFRTVFSFMGVIDASTIDEQAVFASPSHKGLRPLMRSQVALMAAMANANAKGDGERAHELLDVAFLDLLDFQSALR